MIYADNAATSKLDEKAFDAMKKYLINDYGNASEPYSFSASAEEAIKNSRIIIASAIGAGIVSISPIIVTFIIVFRLLFR